jgi:hypothetical protein
MDRPAGTPPRWYQRLPANVPPGRASIRHTRSRDAIATLCEPRLHSARFRRHPRARACREPVQATWRNTPSVETGPSTRGIQPVTPAMDAKAKPLVRVR